ncbi:MAG: N-6 DNA methylase [Chloroflexota bacterium]|nr:N-6 DNA methylase [Chloroflexota bacterium]MCY3582828.1 N-6 DNA methylase [Chloroflexota bacterium]MDE2651906.1 N-6 DNA methylase [Chloroflexota bacterium]
MTIDESLRSFTGWWRANIQGDEKGEAQVFLERLMKAFGHAGALEVGAYEERVRKRHNGKSTVAFADYLMPKRVLIEMKKRGENLKKHYTQLEEYYKNLDYAVRPRYALLCNFDEIWIYDFNIQFYEPVDVVPIDDIAERRSALEFLVQGSNLTPVFRNNQVEVTREAAYQLTEFFHSLAAVVGQDIAQRFTLQCMVAMIAEDVGLLPEARLTRILRSWDRHIDKADFAHSQITMLFTMMNNPTAKRRGRFHDVGFFNGGLFQKIHPISLGGHELNFLKNASEQDWSKIRPSIFGNIFEYSLNTRQRHREGAHYTSEADIKRIVDPVIAEPWRNDIDSVNELSDALNLYEALCDYVVLDPACGSGNFLFVAYREMKALESELRDRIAELGGDLSQVKRRVTARQFHGYDINEFAVELAKVSLMIAKKLAVDEFDTDENPLPLDNLDENIKAEDALFNEWVEFDACIGNPPYLGASLLRKERGIPYTSDLREQYAEVPGRADYCVYWFRKAHQNMKPGARAGLVGTNTIRQNYSRIGGLDYILDNDGHIFDAISSMPWSGDAKVHVSIANWAKSAAPIAPYRLHFFTGRSEVGEYLFRTVQKEKINAALSEKVFISHAKKLAINTEPKHVFEGIKPGASGFVIDRELALNFVERNRLNALVVKPYLIGEDLLGQAGGQPSRYVIDFFGLDILQARAFSAPFAYVSREVLPHREQQAQNEITVNQAALKKNPRSNTSRFQQRLLESWWQHMTGRKTMTDHLKTIPRYIVCSRVTKRPIFDFAANSIRPDSALKVFAFEDDYTFGILQSNAHWQWFVEKASTLKADFRYTSHSVFDTFPFPQQPAADAVKAVADSARDLHEFRRERMAQDGSNLTLRAMYQTLEQPGHNRLRGLHVALDAAVLDAYGFDPAGDMLEQLLELNYDVYAKIEAGAPVTAPGIPADYPDPAELISTGCIQPPDLF